MLFDLQKAIAKQSGQLSAPTQGKPLMATAIVSPNVANMSPPQHPAITEKSPLSPLSPHPTGLNLVEHIDGECLPTHHYRAEEFHGYGSDTEWIAKKLRQAAPSKRPQLAEEYSKHYLIAFTEEQVVIKKEGRARFQANKWLRKAICNMQSPFY
ncbi:hypothetical protein [Photobacterium lipolyticum]|uniref:Uncharacterized protein n=1 Tax=Photobacterium lipolyticum TaxID=266810 RepID=A0A2T3MTG8_9GAMM|nr:hypothetical protein [Photobacterium lipolyticum]PSW02561.1 hypothetical protein C9I89_18755 [Photobacterium lipolyticum]